MKKYHSRLISFVGCLIFLISCQAEHSVEPLVSYDVIYSTMEACLASQSYLPTTVPSISLSTEIPTKEEINILFVGGSITVGAGASSYEKSYAGLLTSWLNLNIPTYINVKNIAIGGTGSDYAAYRLEHDLQGYVPDITFYEFAVNDGSKNYSYIQSHMEILLSKLLQINPEMKVISIITTTESLGQYYTNNTFAPATYAHIDFAIKNGIPVIFAGQYLWHYVEDNEIDIKEVLPDSTHPNDVGYHLYYESIIQYLESSDIAIHFGDPTFAHPEIDSAMNAYMTDFSDATTADCMKFETNEKEITLHCNEGNAFTLEFSGPTLGFVREMRSDGGKMQCNIDGEEEFTVEFWDRYSMSYDRVAPTFTAINLENTKHMLSCVVLDEKPEIEGIGSSEGNVVNILFTLTQ